MTKIVVAELAMPVIVPALILPPTYKSPPIPAPPATINAPVCVLFEVAVPYTVTDPVLLIETVAVVVLEL